MDFTVNSLNKMETEITGTLNQILKAAKVQTVAELNHTKLMTLNKDPLAKFVENLTKLFQSNVDLCKAAAGKIDELKTEQLSSQKTLLKLQQKKLDAVQETVKTEMESWSDIVKKNTGSATSMKSVQKAVKTAVDQNDRSKNLIVHDDDCEDDKDEDVISDVMGIIYEDKYTPQVLGFSRIGIRKSGVVRPLKVTLTSRDAVLQVLSNAKKLKSNSSYKDVYLAPDRNYEERTAHRKLVTEMKQLVSKDSSKHYYIRGSKIMTVDKEHRTD